MNFVIDGIIGFLSFLLGYFVKSQLETSKRKRESYALVVSTLDGPIKYLCNHITAYKSALEQSELVSHFRSAREITTGKLAVSSLSNSDYKSLSSDEQTLVKSTLEYFDKYHADYISMKTFSLSDTVTLVTRAVPYQNTLNSTVNKSKQLLEKFTQGKTGKETFTHIERLMKELDDAC